MSMDLMLELGLRSGADLTEERKREIETLVVEDKALGWALERLTERGLEVAREHAGPHGLPTSLLDQVVLTVTGGDTTVKVPLRCLFALSGMGFTGGEPDPVRVSATGSWLRLDARYGAVARRRVTSLPLLF